MEWSIFELSNDFITVETNRINDIPHLRFIPKNSSEKLPTIIYYHGWQSSKENLQFQAHSIAAYGFQVIVPDALYHGERGIIDYESPDSSPKYLWEIIKNSVLESSSFIDGIIDEYNVDEENIILLGSSMGAITIAGILAMNPRIKGIAGFNGIFSWHNGVEKKVLPHSEEYKAFIECYDLSNKLDFIRDRHILMLNGVDDNVVPISLQHEFLRIAKEKAKNIELIEFNCVGHRITTSMLSNCITWLKSVCS